MNKIKYIFLMLLILIPISVSAANEYSEAKYGGTLSQCTGEYQDSNISTNGIAYFSYCMQATCQNSKYNISYFYSTSELKNNNMIVKCTNGNNNPYVKLHKNGCNNYGTCSKQGDIQYCSTIWMYDCSKNTDGTTYGVTKPTQTKTKKPTQTKKTTEKTSETTEAKISTKLKSLSLSKGSIVFDAQTYEYILNLKEEDTNVEVTAVPEDSKATIEVKNNTNLVDGSVIEVIVTASNNESTIYKLTVKKEIILSGNANLKSLNVTGYDLIFNNKITDYTLVINEEDKSININYETEDEKASVKVDNNVNLTNGSKVTISVTAEDGTVKYYYINILVKAKSNTLGIIFIIILILAILAGAYYLYKKLVLSKSGDKYEYE